MVRVENKISDFKDEVVCGDVDLALRTGWQVQWRKS